MRMKCFILTFLLITSFPPAAEAQATHCSKVQPSFCATIINEPEFKTQTLSRFDLSLTEPVEDIVVEIAWYTETGELKVTTVPQKIIQHTSTYISVDGALTIFEDTNFIELTALRNGQRLFISIPIKVLK